MNEKEEIIEMLECLKDYSCDASEKTDCSGSYHATYIDCCKRSSFLFVLDDAIKYIKEH